MDKPKLLIVDDDEEVRNQMKWALAAQYEVHLAEDRPTGVDLVRRERPAIVTLDLGLPPCPGDEREGFLALSDMLTIDPMIKIVVITGQDEKQNALNAIGQGAYDFFCKPVELEALRVVLRRAEYVYGLERENEELLKAVPTEAFEGMVGTSPRMQAIFETIRKVAATEAPVLISGESGTGKELAARAIHKLGARKSGPFVAINCGAIPDTLLESELFGHEKGAFTGAHIQRAGRIEAAQGGTLFLDEIGDLPPALQVKLLRFLQEQQIEHLGGRRSIHVDTRVLCATNLDLRKAMAEARFRDDLYYRIAVVVISIPALRDRNGDVLLLAQALLQRLCAEQRKSLTFSRKALEMIETYPWPGNVRELENRLKRAVIMAEGSQITPADLELNGRYTECGTQGLVKAREAVEREMIERAIARNRGNLTRCAEELKISRPTLYELIEKLGIVRK
jgi:two-component system, NtrC family, response regulator